VLDNLTNALVEAKSGLNRLVKINVYATRADVIKEMKTVLAEKFRGEHRPAATYVITRLPHPDALVAVDGVGASALATDGKVKLIRSPLVYGGDRMMHVAILPEGERIYVSGQAEQGNLAEATRKTLESLRKTLNFLKLADVNIVQFKAFLQPMANVREVEQEFAKFFGDEPVPPLVFVEWKSGAAVPIEIELIAGAGSAPAQNRQPIEFLTPPGMTASPVYARVTRISNGETIYISGLYGDQATTPAGEVDAIFTKLEDLLGKTNSDLKHLVKATYYVTDEESSARLNAIRPKYYDPKRPPAASKAFVSGVGLDRKTITLDMIAIPVKRDTDK
jgi:enamine deaminase RidA (YjgF/YER057c/UK114 family)